MIAPAEPIEAPLTVDTCACWHTLSSHTGENWCVEDLLIEDASGRALLRLGHADVDLVGAPESRVQLPRSTDKKDTTRRSQIVTLRQRLLQPGDQVVVAGRVLGQEADLLPDVGRLRTGFREAPRLLVLGGGPDEPVVVRYRPG
ncbi:MAG: hypothetical protein IT370_35210 [Deltaproteobacteria bacterium]|nr:hypothetical protein [Deltaproteobacteria bacterium]